MNLTMLFSTPAGLIAQIKTLPSSPQLMQRMMQLLDDPTSTVESLVAVIQLERSLAARVIHLANSPIYKGGSCGSIEEAVQRLGYAAVHEAVMIIMAMETFPKMLKVYRIPANVLWRQSLAAACAARELARKVGEDPNSAYALGLLHNVGMVAIDRWIQQRQAAVFLECAAWPDEWQASEVSLLGYDHAEPTAIMLRTWGFPAAMVEAAKFQFRPGSAPTAGRLAAVLTGAHWVRRQLCTRETISPLPDPEIIRILGLSDEDLQEVLQKVTGEFELLSKTLNLEKVSAGA